MQNTAKLTLTQAIAYFDEAEDLSRDSRDISEKCRDYYDHKQWTEREAAALRKKRQPVITRNRIKPKVDFLKGIEVQTRTDPEAAPRTPGDEHAAETATDAVRFVYDRTKFPKIKSDVFEELLIEGAGGVEVYCKPGRGEEIDICIRRFHWDRLGWDPHSREKDFSDTLYRYAVAWMDYDQAKERYADGAEALLSTMTKENALSSTYDDAPRIRWADAKRKRIRIVKMETLQGGEVHVCEFTRGGFLSEPEPSPYVDDMGVPEWSIILQSAHVDREGNRYGYVKAWLDTQDEINKRASKHLHLVSVRQTYSSKGASEDVLKLKDELAKPDGHLQFQNGEYGKEFGVLPTMDQANAQFQLLQEAKAEIDSVGVHAALSGMESRDLSGKAIGKLQQGSSTELKPLFEAIAQFDNQVCRAVWNRIRQFWTAERWVRVTGDGESPRWVGLNVPMTLGEQMAKENGGQIPEGVNPDDPRLNVQVGVRNNIAEIDVDFTMVEVPDVVNAMQEQFEALTNIFPAIPENMKPLAFEMLVEASSLRNKKRFLDRLKGGGEQGEDPQAQAQIALQQRAAEAKILLDEATALDRKAAAVAKNITAIYSGVQAAQVLAGAAPVAPLADQLLLSGGFEDANKPPIVEGPTVQNANLVPDVRRNTSPAFPAVPRSPAEGVDAGIETPENDGVRPNPMM
jgi:hypothetical protein